MNKDFVEDLFIADKGLHKEYKEIVKQYFISALIIGVVCTFSLVAIRIYESNFIIKTMAFGVFALVLAVGGHIMSNAKSIFEQRKQKYFDFLQKYSMKDYYFKVRYQNLIDNNHYNNKITRKKKNVWFEKVMGTAFIILVSIFIVLLATEKIDFWSYPFFHTFLSLYCLMYPMFCFYYIRSENEEIENLKREKEDKIKQYNLDEEVSK